MLSWYDIKAKLISSRLWERCGSLNGFFTHNLSNIILTVFYLSAPLAIFFLIRHLPAPGVFIIYRKLITYTRLQGSHLLHWLLLQKQLHTKGPWAGAWVLIFTRADRPDSCKMYADLPTISKILSSPALFSHICRVKLTPASLEGSQTVQLQKIGFMPYI